MSDQQLVSEQQLESGQEQAADQEHERDQEQERDREQAPDLWQASSQEPEHVQGPVSGQVRWQWRKQDRPSQSDAGMVWLVRNTVCAPKGGTGSTEMRLPPR